MKKTKIEYVGIDDLKPAEFNPEVRTREEKIRSLVDSMSKYGFWEHCPLTIMEDGTIVDGHRRYAAAKLSNITVLPCIRVKGNIQDVWCKLHETTRQITAKEVLSAVANGLNVIPNTHNANKITKIIEIMGMDGVKWLANNNVSPYVYGIAVTISRYCNLTNKEFIIKAIRWMVENKMQYMVRIAMKESIPPNVLVDRINSNQHIAIWGNVIK